MQESEQLMEGKVCLITGATSGIGEATALSLAGRGATVVGVGRNAQKCSASAANLRRVTGNAKVDMMLADLSIHGDLRRLATRFKEKYRRLDVLVNNAGARFLERRVTVDGHEMTLALNHLAHFHLTNLLLDQLQESGGRIVNVSSDAHRSCRGINFEDLQSEKSYDGKGVYAQWKLATLLFTYELDRRIRGRGVTVNAVDPGNVLSRFSMNNGLVSWMKHIAGSLKSGPVVSPAEGARTGIYLATSPEVAGVSGGYFHKSRMIRSSEASYAVEEAGRLWKVSSELVKLS